jgi:hypothetical protein
MSSTQPTDGQAYRSRSDPLAEIAVDVAATAKREDAAGELDRVWDI